MVIQCPCGSSDWRYAYRSPINPDEDRFQCEACGKKFNRQNGTVEYKALEWNELWEVMRAKPDEWIDTTENMYINQLEAVPPRIQIRGAFLCGEPYTHNREGKAVYVAFRSIQGMVQAKYMTFEQFRREVG